MRILLRAAATLVLVLGCRAPADAGEIRIVFHRGLVTLTAENASPREILAEWARVGRARIINVERASASPVTLKIVDEPERRVIEILLRDTAGYITAPRQASADDGSIYDRILIAPVAVPAPAARTVAAAVAPAPSPVLAERPSMESAAEPAGAAESQEGGRFPYGISPYGGSGIALGGFVQPRQSGAAPASEGAAQATAAGTARQNPVAASIPGVMTASPAESASGPVGATPTGPTAALGASRPGMTVPVASNPVVSNPYGITTTTQPTATPANALNPYGLPNNVRPGSEVGPPVEPDRSKYMNPATPQKPPGGGGGNPEA